MNAKTKKLVVTSIIFILLMLVGMIPDEDYVVIAASKPVEKKVVVTLGEALKAGVPVIVKLGSDKCIPCRMMNPIMKELAVEQDGKAIFLNIDVYKNRDLAKQAGVRVIPTILFYDKHGKPKAKSEGGMSKEQLLKAIKELELNK